MVSCAHCNIQSSPVHIVIAGWLYVIGAVALTMQSAAAGLLTFVLAGALPVGIYAWVALLRLRRRRAAAASPRHAGASGLEQDVHQGDDRDA